MMQKRIHRHRRVRAKISGTEARPRLAVYRSLKHIKVQFIDDVAGKTILSVSDSAVKAGSKSTPVQIAALVGRLAAERALQLGIKKVVFDRGGYAYHGRVKALAEGAREVGLEF